MSIELWCDYIFVVHSLGPQRAELTQAWLSSNGHYIIQTVVVEVVVLQPNLRTAEDIVGGEAHLDVVVGWDENIVNAVDTMFMAYERSHGLL